MVSYYNPLAMYRHQQQASAPGGPPQFHHPTSPAATWYGPPGGYQPSHHHQVPPPPLQQYPNCVQDDQQGTAGAWHHHHHHMFQPEWTSAGAPDFGSAPGMLQGHQPSSAGLEDPQLPSPPITVSSSELSSPGAVGGSVTPPQHAGRPIPVRSPYEWMKKPSYQSQPNPGKTRTKDKYRVVYSDHQRLELEKEFHYSRYITIRRKAELAANLGLSERQVKIWFQNRRAKERKQVKKREELLHKEKLEAVSAAHHQLQHAHQQMAAAAAVAAVGAAPPSHGVVM
ncbi:homeotic protein caudal [Periplaneta americana]|uniref:homeotic protein caudal n=1 Tax=Periplaneta americana TaxID=6978 RepID=UPI0037E835C3